jgi:glycosyltransferase involved in cell wall biosynthesis
MRGILFDARWIRPGMTGIGYSAYHLLRAWPASETRVGIILPKNSPYADQFPHFRVFFAPVDLTHHPLTELFEQVGIPALCYRHGFGNFVSFETRVPAFHPGIRTFSWIHDLSFLKFKGSHNRRYSLLLHIAIAVTRHTATRIVTVSETVRREMAEMLNVSAARILVVPNSDGRLDLKQRMPARHPEGPFFLTVGMTNPRKNLARLLKGFAAFNRARGGDFSLVITGHAALIADACRKEGAEHVFNLGFVSEGELRDLYERTEGLVYPSLDEGFGIPLLDAARFGRPIICSAIPVFREIVEDAAVYFDPESPASIAAGLEAAASGAGKPGEYPRILEKYSWERSAANFLAAIEEAR